MQILYYPLLVLSSLAVAVEIALVLSAVAVVVLTVLAARRVIGFLRK